MWQRVGVAMASSPRRRDRTTAPSTWPSGELVG